jgi:hypothetical protein
MFTREYVCSGQVKARAEKRYNLSQASSAALCHG